MTQLKVAREAEPAGPMAQILWLHHGRWFDVPVAPPVSTQGASPCGWYVDRLRFWDGEQWTDRWRPIARPKPALRLRDEESLRARLPLATRVVEPVALTATVIGLLGMPPALPPVDLGRPATDRPAELGYEPRRVGLLGLPPPLRSALGPARRGHLRRRLSKRRSMLG